MSFRDVMTDANICDKSFFYRWCFGCFEEIVLFLIVFFFNDTATTEIYTLSLHDALPISFVGFCILAASQSMSFNTSITQPGVGAR